MNKFGYCIILIMLTLSLSCCNKNSVNDADYIKAKGVMNIGITEFPPMNYHDAEGNLKGFDTEVAQTVCSKLGVKAEFIEINWDLREKELETKNIDCIWNGTVLTETEENLSITDPYITSKDILVTKNEKLADLTNNIGNAVISVARGSAGEQISLFIQNDIQIRLADSQLHALYDVESGVADAAVIDYLMLFGGVGEGSAFSDISVLNHVISEDEVMVVAFRKGSNMAEKVNKLLKSMKKDGSLQAIAKKYHIDKLLVE